MKIEKKVWPEYFQKILEGVKTYELRLADWKCNPGDILVLKEYCPETKKYTGRVVEKEVTYIGKFKPYETGFWKKEEIDKYGYQIISLKS